MTSLTSVVDQMAAELAERRRTRVRRNRAYLALARVILSDEVFETPAQSIVQWSAQAAEAA